MKTYLIYILFVRTETLKRNAKNDIRAEDESEKLLSIQKGNRL
jgi:hypothetical protein